MRRKRTVRGTPAEYNELEDLQRACAGDLDARLRVEVLLPWLDLLKDIKAKSVPEKQKVIDTSAQCFAAVFVATHELLTPENRNFERALLGFMQRVYTICQFIHENEILDFYTDIIPTRKKQDTRLEKRLRQVQQELSFTLERARKLGRLKKRLVKKRRRKK